MITMLLALAVTGDTYKEAFQKAEDGIKPVVVVVGEDWCVHCNRLRTKLKEADIEFFYFKSTDRRAARIMIGDSIPQTHCFFKDEQGWSKTSVHGNAPIETIRKILILSMERERR